MSILNIQDMGARVTVLGDINDPEYPYYNPSLAYDGEGKLRISIRSCNFTVQPNGQWHFADGNDRAVTKILYGYLDPDTLTITDLKQPEYSEDTPFETKKITGIEDARIFWREDGMHFSGVEIDTRQFFMRPAVQAEYVLDEATNTLKYLRTMRLQTITRPEKNWIPTDQPGKFDFSYSPTEVYKDGEVFLTGSLPYTGFIHGSSQLLWQEDTSTYLTVLHSKHQNPMAGVVYDRYIYLHYFAEYDQNGVLIRISEAFNFGTGENIEFASGMVQVADDMLISLGIRDARMGMARISKQKFISMLKDYEGVDVVPVGMFNSDEAKLLSELKRRYDREQRAKGIR